MGIGGMYDRVINNQGNVTSTDGIKLGINLRFLEFFFCFILFFCFVYSLFIISHGGFYFGGVQEGWW